MSDLVERLHDLANQLPRDRGNDAVDDALREAASRISQQDAELERLRREVEEARAVIAWANNSLFGSHGFFLSLDGSEPDEHHLDRAIEALKEGNRKARKQGIEDTLGALTAHELYQYRPKAFEGFIAYARTTLTGEAKTEETGR